MEGSERVFNRTVDFLEEIKGHDQASEKTKELAADVEERMNRIESEAT